MSNTTGFNTSQQTGYYPALPPQALASVRTRRMIAVLLDLILVALILRGVSFGFNLVKSFVNRHFCFFAFVPSICIVTIETTKVATLQKVYKSNSGAVFSPESFVGMNKSVCLHSFQKYKI